MCFFFIPYVFICKIPFIGGVSYYNTFFMICQAYLWKSAKKIIFAFCVRAKQKPFRDPQENAK